MRPPRDEQSPNAGAWDLACEAVKRESVFWGVDHPSDSMVDRQSLARLGDLTSMAVQPSTAIEGCKAALLGAERMFAAARERAQPMRVADGAVRIRARQRDELQALIEPALRAQTSYDVTRAFHEVEHWKRYIEYYAGQRGPAHRAPGPDRRLPPERDFPGEELSF